MLKQALNALTAIHSRQAMLKRLGSPDIYSPCLIAPSNYFRFLRGPEYTTVRGVEFIIPIDSMLGQFAQLLSFDKIPEEGTFKIKFGTSSTDALGFDVTAVDVQTELRKIGALANVLVTGSFATGFRTVFAGFSTAPELGQVVDSTLKESGENVVASWGNTYSAWPDKIKRGDRIVDGTRIVAVDEIIEMHDLGAKVMAFRVRCD